MELGPNEKILFKIRRARRTLLRYWIAAPLVLAGVGIPLIIAFEIIRSKKAHIVTNKRIFDESGISKDVYSIPHYKITENTLKQTPFEMLLNVGDIILNRTSSGPYKMTIKKVSNPEEVQQKIYKPYIDEFVASAKNAISKPRQLR